MRRFTVATILALAFAATFSMAPAKAELGGPIVQNGMCKHFNAYNPNHEFYYWAACPATEARNTTSGTRVIKVTNHGVGSGIGRTHGAAHPSSSGGGY